jgi:cytochrome c-type biogenesis protein CcmH
MPMTNASRIRIPALVLFLVGCALVLAASFSLPLRAQDQPSTRAKALNDRIMCMCGGCSDAAGKCTHSGGTFAGPCAFAQKKMKEVSDRVASGQSDDLILQSFVQEYGPTVLISPPAAGFDLWAWLMPILVSLGGIAVALLVVRRWKRRAAAAPRVSSDLLARAQHDMSARLDD